MHFKEFEGLLNQITEIKGFSLAVVDLITHVEVLSFEQVHDWKNLSVVWYKGFSDGVGASNKSLQDFQSDANNFWVSCVEGCLDWNDKLWNNWEDLSATLFKHIKDTLDSKESIWINLFTNTFEENW